ncbi:MAG: hypothetical protein H6936_04580 [Burkholderiales bacterium]|nr:hypothetical protein [Nitrosomonas sp.]MCP5274121.1 hypothetical protein [Burkholderiales bacterium]
MISGILWLKHLLWRKTIYILFLSSAFSAHAENAPDLQGLIQQFGIQNQNLASLEQDRTLFFNVAENHEKELAAGVVIYITAAPNKIIEFIRNNGMASIETEVTLQDFIPSHATMDTFKKLNFENGSREAANFLVAKPGNQFNLSGQEFQTLQSIDPTNVNPAPLASQTYGKILWKRWLDYRKKGLQGIATYDRGAGKTADPARELQVAAINNTILSNYYPKLFHSWLNYPTPLPAGADERFLLINRQVEGRPTVDLVHRIILAADNGGIVLSRQFYVGHSYNSNQLTIICLPFRDGSIVFYVNQTFTDQITGFGSSIRRPIGREQMRRRMDAHLKQLSNALK